MALAEESWLYVTRQILERENMHVVGPGLVAPIGVTTLDHILVAKEWEDGFESLQWAAEQGATVAEMRSWHLAMIGGDFTENAL